jgi:uncharacterized peroxidase-related enzyme
MQAEYRITLPALTAQDAQPLSRSILEETEAQLGFVPNMHRVMANSPGLLDTYVHGYNRFRELSGFTPAEQEVVLLSVSRQNGCAYCVAAHCFLADNVSKVPVAVTKAIRDGNPVQDAKLAALANFCRIMVDSRGLPNRDQVAAFLAVGYSEQQILEIILAIAVKTLSNYSNHLFHTPVDALFAARE